MIQPNMTVTIEKGAFHNDVHTGERARVVKVVRCFAILDKGGEICACVVDHLQPTVTAEMMFGRFTSSADGVVV